MMKIAIASGKGGTGKTTVATNIAEVASLRGQDIVYLDCDVEEPNGHIFLQPKLHSSEAVGVLAPVVDTSSCTLCGACAAICQFSAIVKAGQSILTFPELCHSCGGCMRVCPEQAITEVERPMGILEKGVAGKIHFAHGKLNVGEVMSVPLIKTVKARAPQASLQVIDAPPGTSCPVIETVSGVDFCLLVTEATPFGLNDLILAVEMLRALKIPFGVVVNRFDVGDDRVQRYCAQEAIAILGEIPCDTRIAQVYSKGAIVVRELPEFVPLFESILDAMLADDPSRATKTQEREAS